MYMGAVHGFRGELGSVFFIVMVMWVGMILYKGRVDLGWCVVDVGDVNFDGVLDLVMLVCYYDWFVILFLEVLFLDGCSGVKNNIGVAYIMLVNWIEMMEGDDFFFVIYGL